jgi:hypothetical protein
MKQMRGWMPSVVAGMMCAGCMTGPGAGRALIDETFSDGMNDWWVEGGEQVWVEDGRLHMKADPPERGPGFVCTAWHRTPISGNVRIEFDAHVVSSAIDANNINFFFFYSDPSGKPLFETREDRADADYRKYHDLNGYIVTFLKDFRNEGGEHPDGSAKARFRLRRCPGFNLLTETFASHCEAGVTYHCEIVRRDGRITFSVDGKTYLEADDPDPLNEGLIGLRTFRTYLWWDNIRVTRL